MGDGLTVERHQVIILESRRFCFQQLLDFEQLLPPARQSRRDQRSRSSVRNRLETEAAYLRKGSTGTMGAWSLRQHEPFRNLRSRQKRPSRCTGCGGLPGLHVHRRLRCLWKYLATGYGAGSGASKDWFECLCREYLVRSSDRISELSSVHWTLLLGPLVEATIRFLRYSNGL